MTIATDTDTDFDPAEYGRVLAAKIQDGEFETISIPGQRREANLLTFRSLADVAADVDSRPPRKLLFSPVMVGGDYGVLSAADKAGKTFNGLDAAVSCAADLPWLGQFPCQSSGPVVAFLGEGSDAKMLRRIRAIGEHKGLSRHDTDRLPITLCFRVPHLNDIAHLAQIRQQLEMQPAVLMILDPLYLAARGGNGSDLFAMGALLENIQHIAQEAGATLLVNHHWNKTGEGSGHTRSSGVGPGAWGRFLISVGVKTNTTDPATGGSIVRTTWAFRGDEIPDRELILVRRIWVDDPDDLDSPMHYEVHATESIAAEDNEDEGELAGLRPAAKRVFTVLQGTAHPLSVSAIGDVLAKSDLGPLKKRTIQDALASLAERKLVASVDEGGIPAWRVLTTETALQETQNAA